jgi:hypothetical protein
LRSFQLTFRGFARSHTYRITCHSSLVKVQPEVPRRIRGPRQHAIVARGRWRVKSEGPAPTSSAREPGPAPDPLRSGRRTRRIAQSAGARQSRRGGSAAGAVGPWRVRRARAAGAAASGRRPCPGAGSGRPAPCLSAWACSLRPLAGRWRAGRFPSSGRFSCRILARRRIRESARAFLVRFSPGDRCAGVSAESRRRGAQ